MRKHFMGWGHVTLSILFDEQHGIGLGWYLHLFTLGISLQIEPRIGSITIRFLPFFISIVTPPWR